MATGTVKEHDLKDGPFLGGKVSLITFGPRLSADSTMNSAEENPQANPANPLSVLSDPEPLMKGARDAYEQANMELIRKNRQKLLGDNILNPDLKP